MKNTLKILKIIVLLLSILFLFNGCTAIAVIAMFAPGYSTSRDLRNVNFPIDYSNAKDEYEFLGSAYRSTYDFNFCQESVRVDAKNNLKIKLSKKLCKVFENMIEETGISLNGKIVYQFNDEIEARFSEIVSNEIVIKTEEEDTRYYRNWVIVGLRKKTAIDGGRKVIADILKENSKVYFSKELEKKLQTRVKIGLETY